MRLLVLFLGSFVSVWFVGRCRRRFLLQCNEKARDDTLYTSSRVLVGSHTDVENSPIREASGANAERTARSTVFSCPPTLTSQSFRQRICAQHSRNRAPADAITCNGSFAAPGSSLAYNLDRPPTKRNWRKSRDHTRTLLTDTSVFVDLLPPSSTSLVLFILSPSSFLLQEACDLRPSSDHSEDHLCPSAH